MSSAAPPSKAALTDSLPFSWLPARLVFQDETSFLLFVSLQNFETVINVLKASFFLAFFQTLLWMMLPVASPLCLTKPWSQARPESKRHVRPRARRRRRRRCLLLRYDQFALSTHKCKAYTSEWVVTTVQWVPKLEKIKCPQVHVKIGGLALLLWRVVGW